MGESNARTIDRYPAAIDSGYSVLCSHSVSQPLSKFHRDQLCLVQLLQRLMYAANLLGFGQVGQQPLAAAAVFQDRRIETVLHCPSHCRDKVDEIHPKRG